jgi:hypothetical protein
MPKLVGTLTQTQITVAAAAALQPQAGKLFFSSENCKFYFLSGPPIPPISSDLFVYDVNLIIINFS